MDSLTRYFTPTNKRRSRVAQASYLNNVPLVAAEDHSPLSPPTLKENNLATAAEEKLADQPSTSAAIHSSRMIARRRRSRKRAASDGNKLRDKNYQITSLFDGLSHLFSANDEPRKRLAPGTYNFVETSRRSRSGSQPGSPLMFSNVPADFSQQLIIETNFPSNTPSAEPSKSLSPATPSVSSCVVSSVKKLQQKRRPPSSATTVSLVGKFPRKEKIDEKKLAKTVDVVLKRRFVSKADQRLPKVLKLIDSTPKLKKISRRSTIDVERDEPPEITEEDRDLFKQAQQTVSQNMPVSSLDPSTKCPSVIQFGKYEIQTWYSAPYPQEYARYVRINRNSYCICVLIFLFLGSQSCFCANFV